MDLPLIAIETDGPVATLTMQRPDKRNAMSNALLAEIERFFDDPPEGVRVAILTGTAGHFCSGLDLSEHVARSAEEVMHHSRWWHRVLDKVEFGGLVTVSAMFGAVMGGGLELAAATHVRVSDETAVFQLPEGRRGIFVGGGASVRVGRLVGADRMREMMLTGRRYDAADGHRLGFSHHLVGTGEALGKARELAATIAANAPLSNYMMIHAIARIADMGRADGLFTESLAAAIAQTSPDAAEGLAAFLERRPPRFR